MNVKVPLCLVLYEIASGTKFFPQKKIWIALQDLTVQKKLTDAQKVRIVSLRFKNHQSIERIAQLADTSVSIFYHLNFAT